MSEPSAQHVDLGEPPAPVTGDASAVRRTAWAMTVYGDLLHDAGAGLARIDTVEGWSGSAGDAFRRAYQGQPAAWLRAGDSFHAAAQALTRYAETLEWAQARVTEAAHTWAAAARATREAAARHGLGPFADPGAAGRAAALDTAARARAQLAVAGDAAATVVERGTAEAPAPPVASFDPLTIASVMGTVAISRLRALGHAAVTDPAAALAVVGGAGLISVSAAGELGGAALDATGIGAVGGLPLGAASTAGIVAGAALVGTGFSGLADEAGRELGGPVPGDVPASPSRALGTAWDGVPGPRPDPADVHAVGLPAVRGFPPGSPWNDPDRVAETIEDVARDPGRPPVLTPEGVYRFHGVRGGMEIEGLMTPEGRILSGHPLPGEPQSGPP